MTGTIKIAITDDHQIIIDALKLLLNNHTGFDIIAEANAGADMLKMLEEKHADVLITDILMPGMPGPVLASAVRKKFPAVKIIALSMSEDGAMITKMIDEAGVDGYIPKASGKQELIQAIERVASGINYFSPKIWEQYTAFKKVKNENSSVNLTGRELQIIECIVQHLSNKEIANKLFISERTVETHRKNIYRKTDTKGEAMLIQYVKKHNLLD